MKTAFNVEMLCKARSFGLMLVILMGLFWQSIVLADVAVIVHSSVAIGSIDAGTLKSIYLGKLKSWPDGATLTAIDQKAGSEIRKKFINEVIGRKEKKFDAYWSRKAFSGKGTPPKNLGNDVDVKAWVARYKGSIGYIDASMVDSSVKVLLIIK
ncbi:MAG TPA: phosphate ABC transporter substrate-binding protein [Gammaproteobacteria bacterium]|nr:phosphate ABC transporter substrate-binding protein [Gammaproteobacteria bacterium]